AGARGAAVPGGTPRHDGVRLGPARDHVGAPAGVRGRQGTQARHPPRRDATFVPGAPDRADAGRDRAGVPAREIMIFVDSNVPMYVVGSDEALKAAAVAAIEAAITADER